MNSKFALSFGVSLLFVGIFNVFLETNSIIVFGLAIGTIIFSVINIFFPSTEKESNELLYIIPFIILISIFCYSNSLVKWQFIDSVANNKVSSILSFVSFGLLFIGEYINYQRDKKSKIANSMNQITEYCEYSNLILLTINEYLNDMLDKGKSMSKEDKKFLDELDKLSSELHRLASIDKSLLDLNKEKFTIKDINVALKANSNVINHEKRYKEFEKRNRKNQNN